MRSVTVAGVFTGLLMGMPVAAQQLTDDAMMMKRLGAPVLTGKKLQKAIEKAGGFPLGSKENPVRADGPGGSRAYLAQLRCVGGAAPAYDRAGSVGTGPYGTILDLYNVACSGAEAREVYIDMYHRHEEVTAVPGFLLEKP